MAVSLEMEPLKSDGLVRFEAGNLALITCSIPRNLDLSLFQSLKESPRPFVSRMRLKDIVKA